MHIKKGLTLNPLAGLFSPFVRQVFQEIYTTKTHLQILYYF